MVSILPIKTVTVTFLSFCLIATTCLAQDDEAAESKVYSGPQVGEGLPEFKMKLGIGDEVGSEVDLVTKAEGGPVVIIFVHKRSRPAFGLANAVMRYCRQKGGGQLTRGICFLTSDPTDTQNWLGRVKNYFPKETPVGFSTEGIEGPGEYGLNRNVELTVLVGKSNKVTGNFALVQPGAFADGPKILAAIAEATGSEEKKPDINKYLNSNQATQDAPIAIDPGLMKQVRILNTKKTSPELVGEAIAEIGKMIRGNKPLQKQLGTILAGWKRKNQINSIGNKKHQDQLNRWAKRFAPAMNRRGNGRANASRQSDPKLTGLLRNLIQKTNSDEQVNEAAAAIEKYVESNSAAAKELARITKTVVNSDKLSNYGTARCQEILKTWADKYGKDN